MFKPLDKSIQSKEDRAGKRKITDNQIIKMRVPLRLNALGSISPKNRESPKGLNSPKKSLAGTPLSKKSNASPKISIIRTGLQVNGSSKDSTSPTSVTNNKLPDEKSNSIPSPSKRISDENLISTSFGIKALVDLVKSLGSYEKEPFLSGLREEIVKLDEEILELTMRYQEMSSSNIASIETIYRTSDLRISKYNIFINLFSKIMSEFKDFLSSPSDKSKTDSEIHKIESIMLVNRKSSTSREIERMAKFLNNDLIEQESPSLSPKKSSNGATNLNSVSDVFNFMTDKLPLQTALRRKIPSLNSIALSKIEDNEFLENESNFCSFFDQNQDQTSSSVGTISEVQIPAEIKVIQIRKENYFSQKLHLGDQSPQHRDNNNRALINENNQKINIEKLKRFHMMKELNQKNIQEPQKSDGGCTTF